MDTLRSDQASTPAEGEGERQRAGGRGSEGEGERQRAGGRGAHDAWEPTSGDVIGRLLRTASHVAIEQARRLRPTTLSPSAFNVLLELADAPDLVLQPCALANRLAVSRPSMCGLIDGLQAKGLVTRTPHDQDGRRVLVGLSTAGLQLIEEHRAGYDAMLDALLDHLAGNDRRRLVGLLQRIGP